MTDESDEDHPANDDDTPEESPPDTGTTPDQDATGAEDEPATTDTTSRERLADATGGERGPGGGSDLRAALNTALTVVLALALVASIGGVVYVAVTPQQTGESFTEFYVLGPEGNASDYPTNLTTGGSGEVILGVTNNERRDLDYRVEVTWNGTTTAERRLRVPQGETREVPMDLTAPEEPGRYRVRFNLYVDNGSDTVYHRLRLWVQVRDEG